MTDENKLKIAVLFIQFKDAYSKLAQEMSRYPDLDVTESYPFYLLDFEGIEPAVRQWCNIYISRFMQDLPERVPNPGCLNCSYKGVGINAAGLCMGYKDKKCGLHPTILYSREAVTPYLISAGVENVPDLSDDALELIYLMKAGVIDGNDVSKPDEGLHSQTV